MTSGIVSAALGFTLWGLFPTGTSAITEWVLTSRIDTRFDSWLAV